MPSKVRCHRLQVIMKVRRENVDFRTREELHAYFPDLAVRLKCPISTCVAMWHIREQVDLSLARLGAFPSGSETSGTYESPIVSRETLRGVSRRSGLH